MAKNGRHRGRLSPIGIDVSPTAIRMAQVIVRQGVVDLLSAVKIPLDDSNSSDAPEQIGRQLIHTLQVAQFRGKTAVAAVDSPEAEAYTLELPEQAANRTGEVLHQAVRLEMSRLMRFEPSEVQTSHWPLPTRRNAAASAIGVAVPRDRVLDLWTICRGAGLRCLRVEHAGCALARAVSLVKSRPGRRDETVWGVLDVGHRCVRLHLCIGETPVLVRSLGKGGDAWTSMLSKDLTISASSAALYKEEHGLGTAAGGKRAEDAEKSSALCEMIRNILEAPLADIATHIERSYAYVLQVYPQVSAGELLLVGGGANMIGLDTHLGGRLGIPVRPLSFAVMEDPDSGLRDRRVNAQRRVPLNEFATAIGLAIEGEV